MAYDRKLEFRYLACCPHCHETGGVVCIIKLWEIHLHIPHQYEYPTGRIEVEPLKYCALLMEDESANCRFCENPIEVVSVNN